MEATAVRQAAQDPGSSESLGDIVVGCLRRTFDALNEDPVRKTQKGKKELKRTLAVLEQNVLQKLRQYAQEGHDRALSAVSEEMESMREELEIDDLAAQYARSRRAAEEREKKLLRFMSRKGAEAVEAAGLQDKLQSDGLSPDGWNQLLVKSGIDDPGRKNGQPANADASLAILLAELTRVIDETASAEKVAESLQRVEEGVEQAIRRTSRKIDDLAAARKNKSARDPRAQDDVLELLREVVQELCQPLTVVTATVQMLAENRLGKLSEVQKQAADLAVQSGNRLRALSDKLNTVLGVPASLTPDARGI